MSTLRAIAVVLCALVLVGCQRERPTSFLVISLDTFRADRLGRRGPDGKSLTPAMDALAARSTVFTAAYAPANETLFSHAALLTGRHASEWGELDAGSWVLPVAATTLAGRFSASSYWTEAHVAGGHLSPLFGLNTGFRRYVSMADWASFQQTAPPAIARLMWLSRRNQPFLMLVHGYDTHTPYVKAGPLYRATGYDGPLLTRARDADLYEQLYDGWWYPDYHPGQATLAGEGQGSGTSLEAHRSQPGVRRVALTDEDRAFLTDSYDTAAAHADVWVGALLQGLQDAGLASSTVVVVLGDHGEDLMESGWYNHRHALNDATLAVPLIVHVPGQAAATVDTPVSLIDVGPTLLTLAGLTVPEEWTGHVLTGPVPQRAIYSESPQGIVSLRTTTQRLVANRRAVLLDFSDVPGPQDALTDASGAPLPWSQAAPLWPQLKAATP